MKQELQLSDLQRIQETSPPPTTSADDLALGEEIALAAGQRANFLYVQLVNETRRTLDIVRRERDMMSAEVSRLREIELKYTRLRTGKRATSVVGGVATLLAVLGAALISQFVGADEWGVVAGWTCLAVGGLLALVTMIFNWFL